MRIGLISDLHANAVALDAVLEDMEVDALVCLGDVATLGPRPREVLARLRALGCLCIMGNHDEFLLEPALLRQYTEAPPVVAAVEWCRARLREHELEFVRGFQRSATLPLPGGGRLLVFHGSPRSHMEDLLATTPADALDEALGEQRVGATVMAGGHTHLQLLRQHRGALLVNPGSVGCPFEQYVGGGRGGPPTILTHAEYAIVDASARGVGVTLRRVAVDRAAMRRSLESCDNPLTGMWRAAYR